MLILAVVNACPFRHSELIDYSTEELNPFIFTLSRFRIFSGRISHGGVPITMNTVCNPPHRVL